MSDRNCPVCGSDKTGGSPKRWKDYTPDRGRLDIDFNRCHACNASWDTWHYVREDVIEIHDVRDGNGNRPEWGELPPRTCKNCKSLDVKYVQCDGHWHVAETEILRYECKMCGQIWQEMVREGDGIRHSWRIWKFGRNVNKEQEHGKDDTGPEDHSLRNRGDP